MSHWELYHHTYRWTFLGPPAGSATLRTTFDSNNSARGPVARIAPESGTARKGVDSGDQLHDSIILEEGEDEGMSDEDLEVVVLKDYVTDMMDSYSPNLAAHDNMAPPLRSFPKMVEDFSSTSLPPFDPNMLET